MAVGFFGKLFLKKGASKVLPTISSVKPNVPTTKLEKATSKLNKIKETKK